MSDDEDSYVAFGAPLKPLDESDNIRKKPIAIEEQIVRDVNGIRRFHGAFTGGFSAGHFNTVNTPQGWVPQQFKSSRETKSERTVQRPEDFMDDEDRGAFGFAAEALKTKSSFQGGNDGSVSGAAASKSVIPESAFLEQLVQPVKGTVGEALLIKQGWKPGQGIGPKVTRKNKLDMKKSYTRTYGCARPEEVAKEKEQEEQEEEDPMLEKYKDFLFAPDEIPVAVAKPKDNFFGIGYSGLVRGTGAPGVHGDSNFHVQTNLKGGGKVGMKKFSISGEAFGVGADEEDDDSIYTQGTNLAEYDFSLDVSDGKKTEMKTSRKQRETSRWGDANTASNSSCFLEGFLLAQATFQWKKRHPAPEIPHGWTPRRHPTKRKSRFEPAVSEPVPRQGSSFSQGGGSNPSVDQRKSILFPDEVNKEVKKEKEPPEPEVQPIPDFLQGDHKLEDGSFKPFARDATKQKRYELYQLCIKNNRPEALHTLQPRSMTEWEKEREKVEFERASMLFKPMKGVIGSRFVSANDGTETKEETDSLESTENSSKKAASLKMFGPLTRTKEEWHPARLLCVRFNVAFPYEDHGVTGVAKSTKKDTGVSNVFAALDNVQGNSDNIEPETANEESQSEANDVKIEPVEEEVVPKPPMDLFKAIFADSDSEDSDKDDDEDASDNTSKSQEENKSKEGNHIETTTTTGAAKKPWDEKEGNVLRNKEPARGIFANIDFDALNKRTSQKRPRSPSHSPPPEIKKEKEKTNSSPAKPLLKERTESSSSDDDFGPALPPSMRGEKVESITVITSDSEQEESHKRNKKKKDKKKKNKHKEDKRKKDKKSESIIISSDSEDNWKEKKKKRHKDDKPKKKKKHRDRSPRYR